MTSIWICKVDPEWRKGRDKISSISRDDDDVKRKLIDKIKQNV